MRLDLSIGVPEHVASLGGFTLIKVLFASPNAKLNLNQVTLNANGQRDDAKALRSDGPNQLIELFAVQQELTATHGVVRT